jgi:hypothetical protein
MSHVAECPLPVRSLSAPCRGMSATCRGMSSTTAQHSTAQRSEAKRQRSLRSLVECQRSIKPDASHNPPAFSTVCRGLGGSILTIDSFPGGFDGGMTSREGVGTANEGQIGADRLARKEGRGGERGGTGRGAAVREEEGAAAGRIGAERNAGGRGGPPLPGGVRLNNVPSGRGLISKLFFAFADSFRSGSGKAMCRIFCGPFPKLVSGEVRP